jgi:NADH-quinone oxidoreductase subunit H
MELFIVLVKSVVLLSSIMGLASLCTWFERKVSALIQDRVGANRAGAFYTPQSLALKPLGFVVRILGKLGFINTLICDSVKALTKEDFIPTGTSAFMHNLAPCMALIPVFLAFAVVPIAPNFYIGDYLITWPLAPLGAGVLFVFAMGSLAVYGVAIAGWTGRNKYSLLGGLRAAAQMISYELAMGVSLVTMVVLYGTLDLAQMIAAQGPGHWWGIFLNPVAFVVLFIAGMAETKRGPFDLPEAESELTAGYFTEYSGMKFLLFWLGEFAEIALFSFLMAILFLGGWQLPGVVLPENVWWAALIGHGILMAKVVFLCMLQVVIRWSLPRFRYDQLMNLGWYGLLPVSVVSLFVTATVVIALR